MANSMVQLTVAHPSVISLGAALDKAKGRRRGGSRARIRQGGGCKAEAASEA